MSQTRALNQRIAGPHLHVLDLHWKSTHQQHLWPSPPWEISVPSEQCFRTPALWCNRRAAPAKLPSCSLSRGSKQIGQGSSPHRVAQPPQGQAMLGIRSGFRPQPPQLNAAVDVQWPPVPSHSLSKTTVKVGYFTAGLHHALTATQAGCCQQGTHSDSLPAIPSGRMNRAGHTHDSLPSAASFP